MNIESLRICINDYTILYPGAYGSWKSMISRCNGNSGGGYRYYKK